MPMTGKTPFKMYRPLALNASGDGVAVTTLTGAMTMSALDEQLQVLDGGASNRNVTLPPAEPDLKGVFYVINNAGSTNNLVIKDGGSTISTLNPSEQGIYACTGSAWKVCLTTSSTASDVYSNNGAFTGNNTHSGTETFSNAAGVTTDVISERTAAAGVTIDSLLIKDGQVQGVSPILADNINEKTAAAGVTIDGVLCKDNAVTASGGVTANVTGNVTGNCSGDATQTANNITNYTRLAWLEGFGAEAGNAIDGTALSGGIYQNYNEVRRFRLRAWDNSTCTVAAVNATLSLTPAGSGTVVSGSGTNDMVVTTAGADGRFSLRVSDAAAETVYISCEAVQPCAENSTGVIWGSPMVTSLVFA